MKLQFNFVLHQNIVLGTLKELNIKCCNVNTPIKLYNVICSLSNLKNVFYLFK